MKKIITIIMLLLFYGCATMRTISSTEPVYVDSNYTYTSDSRFGTWITFTIISNKNIPVEVEVGCSQGTQLLVKKSVEVATLGKKVVSLLVNVRGPVRCGILKFQ